MQKFPLSNKITFIMSGIQSKTTRCAKSQENVTHNAENHLSAKISPEWTQMLELDVDLK
jgi:hypothetical protein